MVVTRVARALRCLLVAVAVLACSSTPGATVVPTGTASAATVAPSATTPAVGGSASPAAPSPAPSASLAGLGRIVFVRLDTSLKQHVLFTMAPDGSDLRALLPGYPIGFALPRWNWAGDLVGAVSGDKADGVPMDDPSEDRGIETIVHPDAGSHGHLHAPSTTVRLVCSAWSPDGQLLACEGWTANGSGAAGVYTVNAGDGSSLAQLTRAPTGIRDVPGDYSPDGKILFVRTTYEVLQLGEIWMVDGNGGNAHKVTDTLSTYRMAWSRDGRWIAGTRNGSIEVIDLQHLGADPLLIAVPGGTASEPRWSPDASEIVFVYTKTGAKTTEIATVRADGTGFTPITSGNVDASPDWASPGF